MNGRNKLAYGHASIDHLDVDEHIETDDGCVLCGGPLVPLGTLGNLEHSRCRNCGMDQSRRVS
jgi:hypothetical protein